MKVVILCGGEGTRLREETESKPKPLVQIGSEPILWHIMKGYDHFGYRDFILCLGYKGMLIKDYFIHYERQHSDISISLRKQTSVAQSSREMEDWNITLVNTGDKTMTGGRVKAVQKYVGDEDFMLTYGDGVSDVDVRKLLEFHKRHGKLITITVVRHRSKFGVIKAEDGIATDFVEKPLLNDFINAGFMVCKPEIFDLLDDSMFERTLFPELVKRGEAAVYLHDGFWQEMDTYKDYLDLNKIWQEGAPWKVWN